jgi:hypothetical protein
MHFIAKPLFTPSTTCVCEEIIYLWIVPDELFDHIHYMSDEELVLDEAAPIGLFSIGIQATAKSTIKEYERINAVQLE